MSGRRRRGAGVELRDGQILIDGEPRLIFAAEVHYFRLARGAWEDRVRKARAAGADAIASYIPWLWHEQSRGNIDLDGRTRPERDLGAFIDLCRDLGLWFIARPGPYVMAELKNEGLPHWLRDRYPEIVPPTWDGAAPHVPTVDYLSARFLREARRWMEAVARVLAPRLRPGGGNVIAVQLDNEIGMLQWVAQCPDLGAGALADFALWLEGRYDAGTLRRRYPFDLGDAAARERAIHSPAEAWAPALMRDLGHFMRDRFARYVGTLRGWVEGAGVLGVPLIVNVHGTGGGRGFGFPVGISQLRETYAGVPSILPGSDLYLGNLTMENFQDLHICNAFLGASAGPGQPLASLEFECGDGNYANTFAGRADPASIDLKTRMSVAQGNRLLNFYVFAGGTNPRLDRARGDGNDRIAITGERHAWAAPVSPEGAPSYIYAPTARAIRAHAAVGAWLATMEEERDRVALAFVPDHYMTECRYPRSAASGEIARDLEAHRAGWSWETMARAMLLGCYRFGAVDLQRGAPDPGAVPVLAFPSARHLDAGVQRRIVDWLRAGGGLLLYGAVPERDMEGAPCLTLADALGARPQGERRASPAYHLSVEARGWAAPRPEVRADRAQVFGGVRRGVILRVCGTGEACGFETRVGAGRAVVIAAGVPCDIGLFRQALERLGAVAGLRHDCPDHGIFVTSTANARGERFVHLLNLDAFDKRLRLTENGRGLFGSRRFTLRAREGRMLPLGVRAGDATILYSTAEIERLTARAATFRVGDAGDEIALRSPRRCEVDPGCETRRAGDATLVRAGARALAAGRLTVRFR